MAKITFIEHNGTEHEVEMEPGQPLMQIALDNMVPGIDADCGGECACGTCHVIVDPAWLNKTGQPGDDEQQMLDMTPEKTATSRLVCQRMISDTILGISCGLALSLTN